MSDLTQVPDDLPVPEDDGAADHLVGKTLPEVTLAATTGGPVDPAKLQGLGVIYVYPMTGRPGEALPDGWDAIAGARGCTPQACAFRDHHGELGRLGVDFLYGLSAQAPQEQAEAADRLGLTYPLLSDAGLAFQRALSLPTFEAGGRTLLKRLTMIVRDGRIDTVFYPVFPPDRAAETVIAHLREPSGGAG